MTSAQGDQVIALQTAANASGLVTNSLLLGVVAVLCCVLFFGVIGIFVRRV